MDISLINSLNPFPKLTINKSNTEFEIFSTSYRLVDDAAISRALDGITEHKKDSHLSALFRKKGNEQFMNFDYNAAIEQYFKSIGAAPLDSYEYGLALANRSAVLFEIKKYQDCLKDIEHVLKAKYPDNKLGKLFIRQTECFLYLNQNHKAIESWAKASDYIGRFSNIIEPPLHISNVNNKIMSVIEKLDVPDPEIEEPVYPKPVLKGGENPKFLNASNAVELKINENIGRHVVAKIDIEPGDVLFVEEPYSAVRNNEFKMYTTYCNYCLTLSTTNIPCEFCTVQFYCSEDCRKKAWTKTHKWECFAERKQLLSCKLRLVLNVFLKASYSNFKIDVADESIYGNKEDNFPFVHRLITNKNNLTSNEINTAVKSAVILVIYLKKYTDYFEWLHGLPENTAKPLRSLYEYAGSFLLKLCMQIRCNDSEIVNSSIFYKETPVVDIQYIGYGLYVSSAILNHSCNPNTLFTYEKTLKVIRARDKIPKNTEVTIDYCKYRSNKIGKADDYLLDRYKFHCPCSKCNNPCPLRVEELPWLCSRCQGKAFHNNSEEFAQCDNQNCRHVFSIRNYKRIELRIEPNIIKAFMGNDCGAFENVHDQLKKIYHKDNVRFISFYLNGYNFFLRHRYMDKCLKMCKDFLRYCEQFNEVNDLKLIAHLRMMVAFTTYFRHCGSLPTNSPIEVNFIFNETKTLLSFYVPPNIIKQYEQHVRKYLNEIIV